MFQNLNGVNVESFKVMRRRGGRSLVFRVRGCTFRELDTVVFGVDHNTPSARVLIYQKAGPQGKHWECSRQFELVYVGGHDGSTQLLYRFGTQTRFVNRIFDAADYSPGDVIVIVGAPERGVTRENIRVFGSK